MQPDAARHTGQASGDGQGRQPRTQRQPQAALPEPHAQQLLPEARLHQRVRRPAGATAQRPGAARPAPGLGLAAEPARARRGRGRSGASGAASAQERLRLGPARPSSASSDTLQAPP